MIVLVASCIAGWEFFWRAQGFIPSLHDNAMLWSLARSRASELGSDAVVLVGSSRMQMGIHREALARTTGWRPAALRHTPLPMLESSGRWRSQGRLSTTSPLRNAMTSCRTAALG